MPSASRAMISTCLVSAALRAFIEASRSRKPPAASCAAEALPRRLALSALARSVAPATLGLSLSGWESGNHDAVAKELRRGVEQVAAAGADFFICPDNTAHIVLEQLAGRLPIPGLHIAEVVCNEMQAAGWRATGLLGTTWTMTGPVYPGALGRRGIAWAAPGEDDRKLVDDIIFGELCLGVFKDSSRDAYITVIERLAADGCDAVALVCTEIPLLISAEVSPLPILDSTRLLAAAAVDVALGERPMPGWRGGPL